MIIILLSMDISTHISRNVNVDQRSSLSKYLRRKAYSAARNCPAGQH